MESLFFSLKPLFLSSLIRTSHHLRFRRSKGWSKVKESSKGCKRRKRKEKMRLWYGLKIIDSLLPSTAAASQCSLHGFSGFHILIFRSRRSPVLFAILILLVVPSLVFGPPTVLHTLLFHSFFSSSKVSQSSSSFLLLLAIWVDLIIVSYHTETANDMSFFNQKRVCPQLSDIWSHG